MSDAILQPPLRPMRASATIMAIGSGAIALAIGVAAGHPTRETLGIAGAIAAFVVVAAALARPTLAFQVLAASSVMLLVVDVIPGRGLNPFDLLVPTLLLVSLVTGARGASLAERERLIVAPAIGARHAAIRASTDRLIRAVLVFYAIALLSLGTMVASGRTVQAVDSLFSLVRACEGLLLFPLGLWLLRSERDVRGTLGAMLVGGALFATVNALAVLGAGARRAGAVWYVAEPFPSVGSPNEGGTAMLVLIVLLLVRQALRHQTRNLFGVVLALVMLVLTSSRGGLLALLAFGILMLPRLRWTWFAGAVALVLTVVPFVPPGYWDRIGRTLLQERGTFETFTTMIRFVAWNSSWSVFLHNPILGVGYLGFGSVSSGYNELRLVLGPAENYFLEIAAGMGAAGLIGLGFVIVRLFHLGRTVDRAATPGTLGHTLARFHMPLIIALLVPSLVADHFVGLVGLAQVALWCAMLARAGHMGVRAESA